MSPKTTTPGKKPLASKKALGSKRTPASKDPLEILIRNLARNNTNLLATLRILAAEPNRDARVAAVARLETQVCTRIPPGCYEE